MEAGGIEPPSHVHNDRMTNDLQQHPEDMARSIARDESVDPGLATVVDRWPELPDALKAGILAIVSTVTCANMNTVSTEF